LTLGQRYDIIFEANQEIGNYWMHALPALGCSANNNLNNITAIVRYEGANQHALPDSIPFVPSDTNCEDETGLVPVVPLNVGTFTDEGDSLDISIIPEGNLVSWNVNASSFFIDYANPTLLLVDEHNDTFPGSYNVVELKGDQNTVSPLWREELTGSGYILCCNLLDYLLLITRYLTPHLCAHYQIHLHGHDFLLLASGQGNFTQEVLANASLINPTRRDVVTMPASTFGAPTGGFIVIAFPLNNPGNWVLSLPPIAD
jgi:L-ascorbate oxidase